MTRTQSILFPPDEPVTGLDVQRASIALDLERPRTIAEHPGATERLGSGVDGALVAVERDDATGSRARSVRELVTLGTGQIDLLVFRLGAECFALEIAAVEEAVEVPEVRPVPDAAATVVGVAELRGELLTIFSPAHALRCAPAADTPVMLVMRDGERRVALAVDDVEDVFVFEPSFLRSPALRNSADDLVLGVVRAASELVTVLDPGALVAACVAAPAPESP